MPVKANKRSRPDSVKSSHGRDSKGVGNEASLGTAQSTNSFPLFSQPASIHPSANSSAGQPPPHGKLALPPMPRNMSVSGSGKNVDKHRTSHACDNCRRSKSKCSGTQPCEKCTADGKACNYGEGKRDMEKREIQRLINNAASLQSWNQRLIDKMTQLVHDPGSLLPSLNEVQELLGQAIAARNENGSSLNSPLQDMTATMSESYQPGDDNHDEGEDDADADIGSTGSLDVINEDTNRDEETRAVGFLGKSSAVTWVQRAKVAVDADESASTTKADPQSRKNEFENPFIESSYYAADNDFPLLDSDRVYPFDWPEPHLATALINNYFKTVHPVFPIISKYEYLETLNAFNPRDYAENNEQEDGTDSQGLNEEMQQWLCLTNIMFAISAKHAHLIGAGWVGSEDDHLIYIARARLLGIEARTLQNDPSIEQTKVLTLYGLYLLSTDQLNRAWTIMGAAVRHALALGLHVRSQSITLRDADKETRIRLWWSLFTLEGLLDQILGRPSGIQACFVSVKLPLSLEEVALNSNSNLYPEESEPSRSSAGSSPKKGKQAASVAATSRSASSTTTPFISSLALSDIHRPMAAFAFSFSLVSLPLTSSTYFVLRTQLSIISHAILTSLYSPPLSEAKWSDVQKTIDALDHRLEDWKRNLPMQYNFSHPPMSNHLYSKERDGLRMNYDSARIILFRPCLCRFEGRIKDESSKSKDFNAQAVEKCVEAARDIVTVLSNQENIRELYELSQWWSTIHYLVEAASVLMLEIAYRTEHVPSQAGEILSDAKKVIAWLSLMADESISARKAWEVLINLLQTVAPKIGGDLSDLSFHAPKPPHWRERRSGSGSDQHSESNDPSYGRSTRHVSSQPSSKSFASHDISTNAGIWLDNHSTTPRFPAPALPIITSASAHPGMYLTQHNHLMQTFPTMGQSFGVHDQFGPWQNAFYPQTQFTGYHIPMTTSAPAGSFGSMSMEMENLAVVSPNTTMGDIGMGYSTSYDSALMTPTTGSGQSEPAYGNFAPARAQNQGDSTKGQPQGWPYGSQA